MRLTYRGWRWRRRCLLAVGVLMVGCATTPQFDETEAVRYRHFQEQLTLSTQAINAGDLEEAKTYLQGASSSASRPAQQRKVRSLERLIVGAEALRGGDPDRARAEWSQIEEPHLAREVRHKARLIGLDVPIVPLEDETTQ